MFDLEQHLIRQMAHSHATFGPGKRTKGVIDHIRKELDELEDSDGCATEWTDLVILSLDGLTRQIAFCTGEEYKDRHYPETVASTAIEYLVEKQGKNESRLWPNWRDSDPNKAIEHDRTKGVQ